MYATNCVTGIGFCVSDGRISEGLLMSVHPEGNWRIESSPPSRATLISEIEPGHAGRKLAQSVELSLIVEAIHLLEVHVPVRQVQQGMEQVTVMAEPVATAASRSILLARDRQAHVLRNPLDDLIACSVGFDDPAVATDREREGEVQRGDLRVLPHFVVRPDGVQPDQVGDVLLDVTKGRPWG